MLYGNVLLSRKLAEQALTPLHDAAEAEANAAYAGSEGTHFHGPHCGESFEPGDTEGPRTIRGDEEKGWRKIMRQVLEGEPCQLDSGEFPRDLQPAENLPSAAGCAPSAVKDADPSSLHPGFTYKTRPELHIADHPQVPHMAVPQPRTRVTPAVSGHYRTGAECTSPGACEAT